MNCAAEIAVAEKGVSVRVPIMNSQSSAGGVKEEERSICIDASDETREPMPEGPTIFEGSEEDLSNGNGAASGSGKQAEIKNNEGTRAEDALNTPPLQTPLKRKKKEKTVSRLSFSDELGAEDGDGEGENEFGSISQSTNKR